jgi:hypothetical protein
MSMNLVGLAGDLASFKNIGIDQAETALKAIFTGETESLKNLGIVMTETNLNAYAMSEGFGKTTDKMTEAQKVWLRYNYVLDKTKNAQGDFSNTNTGTANSMRIFSESMKELSIAFGEVLLPTITPLIQSVTDFVKSLSELPEPVKQIIIAIGAVIAIAGPLLLVIGQITIAMGSLSAASLPITLTILAIVAAIAALIAIGVLLYQNWEDISKWIKKTWDGIAKTAKETWKAIADFFVKSWNDMVDRLKAIGNAIASFFKGLWDGITGTIKKVWNGIKDFFKGLWDGIVDIFQKAVDKVKDILNLIPMAIETVINGIIWLLNKLIDGLNFVVTLVGIPEIPKIPEVELPRLRVGLDYVPYDDYPALLHKGEMVLTAAEASAYRKAETPSYSSTNYNGNNIYYITIDAKNVKDFTDVVNATKNAQQVRRSR